MSVFGGSSGAAKLDNELGPGLLGRVVQDVCSGVEEGLSSTERGAEVRSCTIGCRTGLLVPPCRYTYCLWGGLTPVPADDASSEKKMNLVLFDLAHNVAVPVRERSRKAAGEQELLGD